MNADLRAYLSSKGQGKLAIEDATAAVAAIRMDGVDAVAQIVAAGPGERAVFALALAASFGDAKVRTAAFAALPTVCATGPELFLFCESCKGLRGWGRGMRSAIARWYNAQTPEVLEKTVADCPSWNGWSHRDLLRMAHPKPPTEEHRKLYARVVAG